MAKTKARRLTYEFLGRGERKLKVEATVSRAHGPFDIGFRACARVASKKINFHPCAQGTNPREAIGRAIEKLGEQIQKRGGAFAGLGRRRK